MLIPDKESLSVEFKSVPKSGLSDSAILDTVIGMTNTYGGILYIGVDNDGTISGIPAESKWANPTKVSAFVADNTVPLLFVECERHNIDNKIVVSVTIPRKNAIGQLRAAKCYKDDSKLIKRQKNVPLYPFQYTTRLSDLGFLDFSDTVHPDAHYDDLNKEERNKIRRLIKNFKTTDADLLELDDEDFDKALGFVKSDGDTIKPTVCGLLMIGHKDRLKTLIPTAGAAFQLLEGTKVRFNFEIDLPLVSCFEELLNYFKYNNKETELLEGLIRQPIPTYSEKAYREALINAFCHRDYTKLGRVCVRMSDEMLEITSPGGFIQGVTLNNLMTVEPHGRNPRLADVFKRIGLAERTGRGVDLIYEGSILYGKIWPDYSESTTEYVKLLIPNTAADQPFIRMLNKYNLQDKAELNVLDLLILSLLRRFKRLTLEELISETHFSQTRVITSVTKLSENGLLETQGIRSKTYILSPNYNHFDTTSPKETVPVADAVYALIGRQGELKSSQIKKELCLTDNQARRVLNELIQKNKICALGERRWRTYRLKD